MLVKTTDGTPDAVKVARPVWSGGKSGDNFKGLPITISRNAALLRPCAYIVFEGPAEERNMNTLVEMITGMEVKEDDESYKNAVDYMFDGLAKRKPDHFAVRQCRKYKLAAVLYALKDFLIKRLGSLLEHTT